MPTLNVNTPDGRTASVQVGDNFASLSHEQQAATVEEIAKSIPGDSWSGDIKGGLHDLGTSLSQGADALGYTGVGDTIRGYTPDAPPGPAPSESLANNLRGGNYRAALKELPHSILRALPATAPILAGGAIGGPIAAGIAAGAEALGPTAAARAAANGTTPQQELLPSLPGAALQGVAGAFIPGGAAGKIANPLLRAGARAGIEGAAGIGMNAAGQAGATAGTSQGLSIDPYEAAASGLTQGALGAGRGVREVAGAGVKNVADRAMASRLQAPADMEQAASVERVGQAMDQSAATVANTTGKPLPPTVVANNVKDLYVDKLMARARALRAAELIDKSDYNQLLNTIDGAQRHNNTVGPNQIEHINGLGLDADTTAALKNDITDLNTVSSQSFQKNETGPFRMLGTGLGKVAGVGAALLSHDPTAIAASLIGHRLEGKVGGAIGGSLDRFFGTNTPPVVLQRLNAQRMLAGRDVTTPNPELPRPPGPPVNPMSFTGSQQGPVNMTPQPATGMAAPTPAPAGPFGNANLKPAPATGLYSQPEQPPTGPFSNANLRPAPRSGMLPPDPVTGLPPSPVPVNTPIPANAGPPPVPSKQPLPAFQPDDRASVASALATDDMAARSQQPPTGGPPAPLTGAMDFVARGLPHMSPEQVVERLKAKLSADEFNRLQSAPSVPKAQGRRYQELADVGLPGPNASADNQGYAVEHSVQARVNAAGYQMFAKTASDQAAATGHHDLAKAILDVASEKTLDGKKAIAQAFEATHPGEQIPEMLFKQFKKS